MPACPVCRDEFEGHVAVCPTDDVALVPLDELPPPAIGQAALGVFHPATVLLVQRFLHGQGIGFRTVEIDDGHVELLVPEPVRDDQRAALTLGWATILAALEPEARAGLPANRGHHPGWYDAPQGAWVGGDGKLRVAASPEEEDAADASRTVGPALAVGGVIVLLLAWVTGFDAGPVLLGISAIVLGLLLPR